MVTTSIRLPKELADDVALATYEYHCLFDSYEELIATAVSWALRSLPITVNIEMTLSGDVPVFAVDADEALARVQLAIDTKTLGDEIDLQDGLTLFTISHGNMAQLFGSLVRIVEGEQAVAA